MRTPAPAEAGLRPAPQGNPKPKSARSYRVEEWFRLPTATVEVRQHGTYVRTAMVDAATPDSRMLWLSPEGVDSRVLIDKRDGYEVWIDPQQLYYTRQHR
jgi:hypothetical protein